MPIQDLARSDPVTASPDSSLREIATTMRDREVGSVIIEENRKPVGIVTDRDITLRTVAEGGDPQTKTAADVMTEDPLCIDCKAGVHELTETMRENGVRRVPVTEGNELVGIITYSDLQQLLTYEHENLSKVVEAESPAY